MLLQAHAYVVMDDVPITKAIGGGQQQAYPITMSNAPGTNHSNYKCN